MLQETESAFTKRFQRWSRWEKVRFWLQSNQPLGRCSGSTPTNRWWTLGNMAWRIAVVRRHALANMQAVVFSICGWIEAWNQQNGLLTKKIFIFLAILGLVLCCGTKARKLTKVFLLLEDSRRQFVDTLCGGFSSHVLAPCWETGGAWHCSVSWARQFF